MNSAIRTLFGSLIDYAGLFPPAGLDMNAAVADYAANHAGEFAWMLGRFILPVTRLQELESAVRQDVPERQSDDQIWRLSVLAGTDLALDLAAIADFNARQAARSAGPANYGTAPLTPTLSPRSGARGQGEGGPRLLIDTIELKAMRPEQITVAMQRTPADLCAYFEVPVWSDESVLAVARSAGARVKVRTGGVTTQAFPTCAELAGFLYRCAAVGVTFKATAGLHHPIRSVHRLTYADDGPQGTMHGFLNVLLTAAGVRAGMTAEEAARLLDETSPAAIQFDENGASWGKHRWSTDHLRATRQDFAISFGSCSFQEPIDDLKAIGLL